MATTRASLSAALKLNNSAFKKGLNNSKKEVNKFSKSVKSLSGVMAGAFTARALINFTAESAKLAAQMEGVAMAFERISPSVSFLNDLKEATAGTVSELALMKRSVMAANFKIPMDQLASLLKFATKRAQETGESVDYLVNSIVIGIGRKSPLILDNLGISAVQLREKLDHVGHSGATVGDVAKAVGDIATEELGAMGDVIETSAIRYARLNAQITDMRVKVGDVANEFTIKAIPVVEKFVRLMDRVATDWENFGTYKRREGNLAWINTWADDLENLKKGISDAVKMDLGADLTDTQKLIKLINEEIVKQGDAILVPTGAWTEYHQEMIKGLQRWKEDLETYGMVGEAGAETIKNLKAELEALIIIQESLPLGDKLDEVNARIKEINETIDKLKGKVSETKTETREFVDAFYELQTAAQKGYEKAADYFAKIAKESQDARRDMASYLYENEEIWEGGREAWEDISDEMKRTEAIMEHMKRSIGVELVAAFNELGAAIGRAMSGAEAALGDLVLEIANNVGYLVMMAGIESGNWKLVAIGAAIQLGIGIFSNYNPDDDEPPGGTGSAYMNNNVTFEISGENLHATLDRYETKQGRFT